MPYIEQLLYGHNHLAETSERQELAHSAGMGADVATEIAAVCDAWGSMPELGLTHSVLLSHPLLSTMPSMRGRLYTIVHIGMGTVPLFHAIVVTDAAYSGFGRNPYALAQAVEFCDKWNGKQGMDRVEVEPEDLGDWIKPAPGPGDVGLVDEAVLQFILTGRLQLPLEQAVRDSDRAMALIIACLPEKDRKELKFASFTTAKVNAYDIAGLATEGATFASWQRLMMARIDTGVSEQQQEYKRLLAEFLARGDMVGVARVSSRHNLQAPAKSDYVVATRQGSSSPRLDNAPPRLQQPAASSFGPAATIAPGTPGAAGAGFQGSGLRPTVSATGGLGRRGAMPDHGLDPTSGSSARHPQKTRSSRNRSRGGAPFRPGKRGGGGRILRSVSVLLLLFVAGWVGTMWLEGRTLAESLEWAGLPGMDGPTEQVSHAGTLLEVVDVGHVYDRARKHAGGKGLGLSAAGDKGREKALGKLQSEATGPLLDQVALFIKLSDEGIQQSGRPDREVDRLESLAAQGAVLEKEMARLELAWFSLTTGTNWLDLGKLTDSAVEARRDSLAQAEKGALADVRLGMGTTDLRKDLSRARRRMDGMAAVVRLFQAPRWSSQWEQQLAAAAEKVSPSAGKTTRAYRNSAFALVRLKRAERGEANRNLPFAGQFKPECWPSPQVQAILPLLRKEAGRFSDQNAPALLGATIGLYSALAAPERTITRVLKSPEAWRELQDNAAVSFDPELYGNFLGRLRFEAAARQLTELADPAEIPAYLFQGEQRWAVAAFADSLTTLSQSEQWQAMAAGSSDPFLGRWAEHLAQNLEARLAHLRQEFSVVWAECRAQTAALQSQAKAGYDWSDAWRSLQATALKASHDYAAILGEDPTQQPKFAYLDTLVQTLTEPRPLRLSRITVRLDQALLNEASEVQLELRTPERGGVWTSEPFVVGPGAPAGTGWVGTAFLDWTVPISPVHQLNARVVTVTDHSELLEITYPSLAEGVGPAALVRPRISGPGSVGFKAELEVWWRSLEVPEMGSVF